MTLEELKRREKELRKKYGDELYEKMYIRYSAASAARPAEPIPPVYKPADTIPSAPSRPVVPNIPYTPSDYPDDEPPKSIEYYEKSIEELNKKLEILNRQQYRHMLSGNDNKVKALDLIISNTERKRDYLRKLLSAAMGIGSENRDKDMLRAPEGWYSAPYSPDMSGDIEMGDLSDRGYDDTLTSDEQISPPTDSDRSFEENKEIIKAARVPAGSIIG